MGEAGAQVRPGKQQAVVGAPSMQGVHPSCGVIIGSGALA